ncbi:serine protease 7-like [Euwallacea similis]|uniref:serine protease 7-like n=1 Tax=Euwallacea similis TaxID=1736056 RepID=UPI00344E4F3F
MFLTPIVVVALLLTPCISQLEQNEAKVLICRTPNGDKGECVRISDCELFLKLLLNGASKISTQERQFIKASECAKRKLGELPMVCCGNQTTWTNANKKL